MRDFYVYFAVIVSGASVLAIEILGTRIIGPFYGVSLFLWSALISVTLAALSLGYFVGGYWADRGPTLARFSSLLALAGLWIVAIPWIKHPLLALAEPFGLRFAVLFAAFILFFPPLALLGMVSPYAIRLKASTIDVVGRTAGNLYAVSTVASVVAALATGFFLIPSMGVSALTFLIGVALVGTALVGFASRRSQGVLIPAIVLLVALIAAANQVAPVDRPDPDGGLIVVEHSPYAEIRVVDRDNHRYLLIDGSIHTIVDPTTWESYFAYVDVLDIAQRLHERPGRLLLVGVGGGSVIKRYAEAGWTVDAVEIDPVVTRVATEHFGLHPSEADVYDMDGRQYLIERDEHYDVIIMDAFGSSSIPFHLVTRESFELIASRLHAGGTLAMNIESVGWHDVIVRSLGVTMSEVFEHVIVLPIAEPPNALGNLILLASNRPLELLEDLPEPTDRFASEYYRLHAWVNRFAPDPKGAPILTDEHNPIDLWAERINLVARKDLHEHFGREGLSW